MLNSNNAERSRGGLRHTIAFYLPPLLSIGLLLLLWGIIVQLTHVPPLLLPAPRAVINALWEDRAILKVAIAYTLVATLIGLSIALLIALIAALAMDLIPLMRRALYPLVVVSQTIQILAVAPLIILWIGLGVRSTIAIVILFCFFPVLISLIQGLEGTPLSYMRQLHIMRATPLQIWWHLRFPYALSSLFAGLRIAVTYSVIAATIGEWVGGSPGLGRYILRSKNALQTAQVFSGMLITTLLSIMLFGIIVLIEHFCMPWRLKVRHISSNSYGETYLMKNKKEVRNAQI